MSLNKSVIAQWTAALTSGNYSQGTGALRRPEETFCCFGVLCDLYAQEHPEATWIAPLDETNTYGFSFDQDAQGIQGLAPTRVMQWAGLTAAFDRLVVMNDAGHTFPEIVQEINRLVAIGE